MSNSIFSYTNRSLESARQEGMSKIPQMSRGDWTDLNPTDPGMILLDYVHALVDMVQFYQDHNALESFILTAKERKNIFRLAKQLSYNIRSAKGATVDVEFYTKVHYDQTIKIPKYTTLSTDSGIKFLTQEDAYLYGGQLSVTVPCIQGELSSEYYQGTGLSRYSNVENAADQKHQLLQKNIDLDTIEISDDLNNIWTPVDYIVFSEADQKVYQKVLNPDGTITIVFGNGERGFSPRVEDSLLIEYVYNLAEEGRTGAETIVNIGGPIFDINGNVIDIYVRNRESTAGGSGPESDESITERAPGAIKSQDRAVTLKDFENLAKLVDGVSDAIAYDINKAPDLCLHHEVKVLIIPEAGSTVNSALIKNVYDYLYQRMIPPTNLQVLAPSPIYVDIEVSVVRDPNMKEGGLEYSVKDTVERYFLGRSGSIGEPFHPQELSAVISSTPGVRYVSSISPNTALEISQLSVVKLGNLKISVI